MALVSPGVEVTIVDESQYLPAAPSSVPLVILATAQNKVNPSGTGIAVGTLAANANKLYRVTSQRDLVTLFGNPFFYKTTNGTPIQGYELNEYGLLAAYSSLGSSNLAYVIRANIDLASLIGRTGRPMGEPADGTWWLNTTTSTWGIFEFNQSTGQFTTKTPIVITDTLDVASADGMPLSSIGNIGDYAINSLGYVYSNNYATYGAPDTYWTYWYKNNSNEWVQVGGAEWKKSWPTIQGTASASTTISGGQLVINGVTVAIPPAPLNTLAGVVGAINSAAIPSVSAASINDRLNIYSDLATTIVIGTGSTPAVISDLAISVGTFYAPALAYGTNAQQPLWRTTDAQPHPTGSVWIKINEANRGINLVFSQYRAAAATWINKVAPRYKSDWAVNAALDSTGGAAIPANSLYAQYDFDGSTLTAPLQVYRRSTTGPSVFVGATIAPTFDNGSSFTVRVSVPGSNILSSVYTVSISGSGILGAAKWVTAWQAANIPYTTAEVSTTGAIILTHTAGGVIILDDGANTTANSPVTAAGFILPTISTAGTVGVKWGPYKTRVFTNLATTGGTGTGLTLNLTSSGYIPTITINSPGAGYAVGNIVTITGGNPDGSSYTAKITAVDGAGSVTALEWYTGFATPSYTAQLSNWVIFQYIPNEIAPGQYPANNTNWYYSVVNQVDIMTNLNGVWKGYRNVGYGADGLPSISAAAGQTDPNGPIIAATAPETQSDGTPLVYGDLWIDSNDLENYPVISRWQNASGVDQWVTIDNTDQLTDTGVLFADARWAPNGTVDPVDDPIPTIQSLLISNYLDLDAPEGTSYPQGMLLWNTRRSGYNVKQYRVNYFNAQSFPDMTLPQETSTWVTVSGNQTNGAPYMGRKAQRIMVVRALKATVDTSSQLRDEDTFFNLMACPNYCELQPNMITLNNDRAQTAYIIGDTPMRLADNANDIVNWATNAAGATTTGEDGLVTRNTYMGLYYPSGITTDLQGSEVVIPPSHMILRTVIYNDTVAYPWFAPAGQRRGVIDNATNIGYIDAASGEFIVTKNRVQLRDVEYTNFINPIAFFTNLGLLNYGNKNSFDSQSSLDRTNVARLINYLRYNLQIACRPFLFEPNDALTRAQVKAVVATLLADIQAKRGVYDYLVVCDDTNNTPARVDRNELWVDVAIEPTKAVEFIYIPIRILNTGELAGLAQNG